MPINRRVFLQTGVVAGIAAAGALLEARAPARGVPPAPLSVSAPPALSSLGAPPDEDGYELWLRYRPVTDAHLLAHYRAATARVVVVATGPIAPAISAELDRACAGMLDQRPVVAGTVAVNGTVLIGTPDASPEIRKVVNAATLATLGDEGFALRSASINGIRTTIVAANHERGLLYGTFALIKQMQLRQRLDALDIVDVPRAHLRLVNHWDSFDRTIERGYGGLSIFHFLDLTAPDPRYEDYARILASVGINGTVINNVNANPEFLASEMMPGYASLAGIFRRWGIRLYLSANFASPVDLTMHDPHPITTADPLDKTVQAWWAQKAAEIYRHVPDFGGFLVKASSEGEPGPLSYNRTHAQGANMLARALKPHGGIVVWRSFVHKRYRGWSEYEYLTFHPLDGQFDDNVIVQTKNGPIDFLVREPVNPLFGAMPRTNQMIELQITQEYTGHATQLCYLPSYWHEVLAFETHHKGTGPSVGEIVDGSADKQPLTGFAGVINFGDDRNWTGSFLAAANTHGYARLAWDHTLDPQAIATEWVRLTFGADETVVSTVVPMLLGSWRTYEKYTSPFGVGYLMRPNGAHYEPDPRGTENYSHYTDSQGSGYDRTLATGSGFTRLYSDYWFNRYEHLETCPEELMMFMHIVPWDHRLTNGKTAIQQIYDDHFAGVDEVLATAQAWQSLAGRIDDLRFAAVSEQFTQQTLQSRLWRDVLISYYFDNARAVSSSQPWLQLEVSGTPTFEHPTLIFGGAANELPLWLTNATAQPQSLTVSIDPTHTGWAAKDVKRTLGPRESRYVSLSITPPREPYLGPAHFRSDAETLSAVGFDTPIVIVTPTATDCTYAFDVGSTPNKALPGYRSLTRSDIWRHTSSFGWIGTPPDDAQTASTWDRLQDDCASDSVARALRLRIPPGKQRAWVLIGGQGSGTQPVRVSLDGQPVVETGYLAESVFQWFGFTADGGAHGKTVDLVLAGADGRRWRLAALVLLKPGL